MSSSFQLAAQQAQSYETYTRAFMEGSAQLLAESAGIDPGAIVLDLACGTGLVARHVAGIVSATGRVVGADINPAMLEIARGTVGNTVEWVQSPCDDLPFDNHTFTHVICQQGFQFFPDLVAAMREAGRVLQPGGALLATVWATPGQNPYIENQLDLLAACNPALVGSVQRATPPHADQLLRSAAGEAGLVDIDVTMLTHQVDIADFPGWFIAQTGGTPWGPTLAALTEQEQHDLVSTMTTRMLPYALPGAGHRIPFRSHRLEARRSR
jgi:ubiquinone/menaquinone biosynthesis C-methylase UbiE